MYQYLDLCRKTLSLGIKKSNRTGVDHIGYTGDMMKFHMENGFPVVTTKKFAFQSCIAEMIGFLRGYDNAANFRVLGTKVWDANANKNEAWLKNPCRKGTDDLGRIYGVQARNWKSNLLGREIDQLACVYNDLKQGIDNRREIVTHWNPGELYCQALPPCHLLYQFGIQGKYLNLSMYQRSCDIALGIPFNITGYAWLLCVMAKITDLIPGEFTHFMHDIHIYENQIPMMEEQIYRKPYHLPSLVMKEDVFRDLVDLGTRAEPEDFTLIDYQHHDAIAYPFAV